MESWRHFIWLKRVAPLLVLVVGWQGYSLIGRARTERRESLVQKPALATAQIWIATAHYRNAPDQYITYRDSVLSAYGLSADQMFEYLQRQRERPEQFHSFTAAVKTYV